MAQRSEKRFQLYDFSADDVQGFLASAKILPECCMLVPGAGKAQEVTRERAQAKMVEARAAAKDGETPTLAPVDRPTGLHISMPVDCQMLDDWLRPQIPDLPEIGRYAVVQPPRNPDVALRVRWEE